MRAWSAGAARAPAACGSPRLRSTAAGPGRCALRLPLPAPLAGGGEPDAFGGQKMCHGKQPSGGGALLAARRRALAAALWLQLALSLGPGLAAGGFDDLQACADPGAPEHGYKMPSAGVFFESVVVRFHCQEGYRLNGTSKKLCVRHFNGSLSWKPSDKPVCLQEVCPLPPMVSHGDYICHPRPCERYNHGTVVEFYCDPGYTLANDYKYITCQYGEWFPSYQVYCVKTEQTWPNTQETLLTTWKIVAFTATSVLLVLLLVILARMFQTKFKTHFLPRGNQEGSMGDPDFVVVDGVPVMLPSYDEAVSSGWNALAPGYSAAADQGHILQTENQNPPAYPGPRIPDTQPSEFETCDSRSGSSELLQSLYPSLTCQTAALPSSDRTDVSHSTDGDAVSTSPRIDITDGESCIGAIGESMDRGHNFFVGILQF
ncbi:sushi domain-containing protein 4 isoform X9 [Agelaius phoeniceus]|uniref:sushi domain-containing protein 4 isoform X9 n=1 Tax=Agelaius phoeniceus TaxID=39638 RepID=UPI0040551E9B